MNQQIQAKHHLSYMQSITKICHFSQKKKQKQKNKIITLNSRQDSKNKIQQNQSFHFSTKDLNLSKTIIKK
jgi:hypothetical protein